MSVFHGQTFFMTVVSKYDIRKSVTRRLFYLLHNSCVSSGVARNLIYLITLMVNYKKLVCDDCCQNLGAILSDA